MGKTVLLVDDEPDILQVVGYRLEKAGYRVVSCANGEDALRMVKEVAPDLVLLDAMMPGIDGFDVCRRLKNQNSLQRVIIYTAKVDGVNAERARDSGADDFTVKTVDLKYILEAIGNLVVDDE